MLRALKWLLVLPAAVLAMLGVQLVCEFIAYTLGDSFPLNVIRPRWIAEFLMSVCASMAFVRGGSWIAPSRRSMTAFMLAALMAIFALWSIYTVVSLPSFSLGATVVWPGPCGLRPHESPAWWQLLTDVVWGLTGFVSALHVRKERQVALEGR